MLILSRKPGEKIRVGTHITLTVVEVQGNRVRLGIEAPPEVHVLRSELAVAPNHVIDCGEVGGEVG
jgi:carbon storage regulator